ncbi:ABC transporter ATP-binding protein/permease [Frankia sp. Ag45/Mut15]|uniref:ABC transporter ATP-binding protein/permease n=1 Tax=Frankia umida TaxID=573489 RepID=A0ABT0JVJ8_9ACTN|nr:ABC transporter ATP-binding protein [Frankia umida]MCK9875557.1 ABC transporter ATP-binding protein/permease [Frankia umida]
MAELRELAAEPSTKRVFRRFWPYLRPHRVIVSGAVLASLASTAAVVAIAPVIGWGVDAVTDRDRSRLWWAVVVLVAVVVARMLLLRQSEVLLSRAGERTIRGLRDLVVERLAAAPLRFLEAHRTGDLLRRSTGEIADLTLFLRDQLPNLIGITLTVILTIGLLLVYSWLLTLLLVALFLPLAAGVLLWFNAGAAGTFGRQAASDATMTATFTETLTAHEALVAPGRPDEWVRRFRGDNDELRAANERAIDTQCRLELFAALEGLATAALLLLGVWLVRGGHLGVGTVVVFVVATRNLFENLLALSGLAGQAQQARVGLARLVDLLTVLPPVGAPPPATTLDASTTADATVVVGGGLPERGELAAEGLTFAYGDTDVVRDVSVAFPPGDRAGLIGVTGSGKTTLAKLLTGLYEPDSGVVRFGGVDLRTVHPAEVRARIVLVPQQVHLISGTLAENLALTPGTPDRDAMRDAVARLGLTDWVDGLDGGLDADLGARGERLSAGERQIVGLLRAALVDPPVLVLDEATADLDPQAAQRLEDAVERLRPGRTLLVIAHRPTTIERLPRTVRVEAGRLS